MTDGTPGVLRVLAERAGVIDRCYDAFGSLMVASDAALKAALAALGWPAADEAQAARSLAALEAAPWAVALPPCVIHRLGDTPAALVVPVVTTGASFGPGRWSLTPEEGSQAAPATGSFDPQSLTVEEPGPEGKTRRRLDLGLDLPIGYHRLRVEGLGPTALETVLIVAPRRCWLPEGWEDREGPRLWGVATQVHGLRSLNDWGMGDFESLAVLARLTGRQGGDLLGVSPLHALFPARPLHASPYSPNSRLFLNPLYISIPSVPEYDHSPELATFTSDLGALQQPELIDLAVVAAGKWSALAILHQRFVTQHLGRRTPRGQAFTAFLKEGGDHLEKFAIFQALSEHYKENGWSWRDWPAEFHDPAAPAVAEFARDQAARVLFHQWCQFEADRQLAMVAKAAADAGQRVGLYRDLALGSDPTGADCWALRGVMAEGLSVGAPPDPWNAKGQNWGFPPFHPGHLREAAYQPFARMIRANMRDAGALRMDHVLGLMRLFCIPWGMEGREGFYLRMPFEDLLAILALESHRARCIVVGEDLGTVPDGFRDLMREAAVLSYRLFFFERGHDQALTPPEAYPRLATVAASTHDLPTLAGFWSGRDLAWKNDLDLFPSEQARNAESMDRHNDRPRIRATLAAAGTPLSDPGSFTPPPELVPAVTAWLARTPSLILMLQIEDVLEMPEQANMPGTIDQHPNWRRRIPLAVEALEMDGRLGRLACILASHGRGAAAKR
ncbi:4-alpha-glucanotransferase [Rhodospirillum rubrum]|nr:4-alpha-glucanotransferase [Rhodospirillum rubrum]MBK1675084.1 4-alpha-glucanotransferase [Rhodospirillum rubrum]